MLPEKNISRTIEKQKRLVKMLRERIFIPVGQANLRGIYQTTEPLFSIPDDSMLSPLPENAIWGGEGIYAWFKGDYTVPASLAGQPLFAYPKMGYYEGMLWLNGAVHSNLAAKFIEGSHGNHYCNRITACAKPGETFEFALELYANHDIPGTSPLEYSEKNYFYPTGPIDICVRDDEILRFVVDFNMILMLRDQLPEASWRRADIENALHEIHLALYYDIDACSKEDFLAGMRRAQEILTALLEKKNGTTTPEVSLIGHSHMDTMWLWPLSETKKKCARTYANQLNLMDEYPEYMFIQSSAYHSDIIRRRYPELFERIQKRVGEGRYEPNGGVWVECDCNLTGAEYMVRQFVWGQKFTRRYFGYTSDCFWLPDTFGYSYAIPQIMKGCGVNYFLTTKTGWNDTTRFPYSSFIWQGLDGTRVLSHINATHGGPTPRDYDNIVGRGFDERRVSPMRLYSYGRGDGGGGPEFEEIENARRLADLEGTARSHYETVSSFMQRLEKTISHPSVYADEIYLELHRGTLTSQHEIKRGNRKLEQALHNLELAIVRKAVANGEIASGEAVDPMMNTLLVRQFHDVLPGSSIHAVNEETHREHKKALADTNALLMETLGGDGNNGCVTLMNTLSFPREDTVYIPAEKAGVAGCLSQRFTDLDGNECLAVRGVKMPAFGGAVLSYSDEVCMAETAFRMEENVLITPFVRITFNDNGAIASMIDLANGRELVGGLAFNTFLFGEDVPKESDAWDIDSDLEDKLRPSGRLVSREVVSCGAVECRIRQVWRLSDKLTIRQDMIFDAFSPMIAFDTEMDWQEEHRFLKTAFDTTLHTDNLRSEIQFGNIRRSNRRSDDALKAKFEVCQHKYSDLSEPNYGIAILSDCKYGISCLDGSMRLSLHKGGMRPDSKGDKGLHRCRYAILVHAGAFAAETVIRPAYCFSYEPVIVSDHADAAPLLAVDAKNVIVETVKPCEDAGRAYILRLYEAAGAWTKAAVSILHPYTDAKVCNMLEEELGEADLSFLTFRPFEIKTIKITY